MVALVTDLLWPGDERAGDIFADAAVLAAMIRVEAAWLGALADAGIAPPPAADELHGLVDDADIAAIAAGAEAGGNPVIALLGLVRPRLAARNAAAASWLHKGLTSQDTLDTALVLCLRPAVGAILEHIADQVGSLSALARRHRSTPMAGRTLTQHAVPITAGLRFATWLNQILDARERLTAASAALPVQLGGAAGSLAAVAALAGTPDAARRLVAATAAALDLPARDPWHTSRIPVTSIGDALVTCTDAWGRLANDVLTGSRPEIGELVEEPGEGRGGSSAMPNKRNPVLAVLVRRAALAGPPLAATLHAAAAATLDERADGAWHVEWATIRALSRLTVTAAAQTSELLRQLRVDVDRMAATLAAARPGIDAEQRSVSPGARAGTPYAGAADQIIDAALDRARPVGP
ncbi:3-carboxy-cis,cis-muconate cycloisomerase [Dactylosporangium vinaceum]